MYTQVCTATHTCLSKQHAASTEGKPTEKNLGSERSRDSCSDSVGSLARESMEEPAGKGGRERERERDIRGKDSELPL